MKNYSDLGDIMEKAKDTATGSASKMGDEARNIWSSALLVASHVSDLIQTVRRTGVDDLLGSVGLMRKPGIGRLGGSFTVGLAIGAGLGILFAPKSGAETRHMLYRTANDAFTSTKDRFLSTKERVTTAAKKLSDRAERRVATDGGARYPS
jgi:YtxH-like protein